jgi:hypothetical protein
MGLHFGDGDGTTMGIMAFDAVEFAIGDPAEDYVTRTLLQDHIGYQNSLPWPADFDHTIFPEDAKVMLSNHARLSLSIIS